MNDLINFQDRASEVEPKRRDSEGGRDAILCGRGYGNHIVQGPNHIQPISPIAAHNKHHQSYWFDIIAITWRRKAQKLDPGLRLPHRPLLVLVRLARPPSTGSQEIPGSPLRHFLHLLLRSHSVHAHRSHLRTRLSGLDFPLWWRSFHYLIRRMYITITVLLYLIIN